MVFQGSPVTFALLVAAICLPPLLALRLFYRSHQRARRRQLPAGRFRTAAILTLVGFLYNVGAVIGTLRDMSDGSTTLTAWQGIAIAVAWITFWVWLFMAIALGRDLGRTSGLR